MNNVDMKVHFVATWLFAALLLLGCESDSDQNAISRFSILDVDYFWQGSLPVEFAVDENVVDNCREEGETGLLIPFSFSSEDALQLELYGCWQSEVQITCEDGLFGGAEIDLEEDGRVIVSLTKERSTDCPGNEPSFQRIRTIDVSNDWQPGELEVVIRNSGEDLSRDVTVD